MGPQGVGTVNHQWREANIFFHPRHDAQAKIDFAAKSESITSNSVEISRFVSSSGPLFGLSGQARKMLFFRVKLLLRHLWGMASATRSDSRLRLGAFHSALDGPRLPHVRLHVLLIDIGVKNLSGFDEPLVRIIWRAGKPSKSDAKSCEKRATANETFIGHIMRRSIKLNSSVHLFFIS